MLGSGWTVDAEGALHPASDATIADNRFRNDVDAPVIFVRNGANGNSGPLTESPQRMIATQSYLNMHNQYLGLSIHTHKGNGGGCFGDSGGPHLLNEMIVSITSNGDGNCVATDNTQRIDQPEILSWIQGFIGPTG